MMYLQQKAFVMKHHSEEEVSEEAKFLIKQESDETVSSWLIRLQRSLSCLTEFRASLQEEKNFANLLSLPQCFEC